VTIALASSTYAAGSGSSVTIDSVTAAAATVVAVGAFGVMSGDNAVAVTGVSDSADNSWNLPAGAAVGYYYSAESDYVGLAIAWCTVENALSDSTVTVSFSASTIYCLAPLGVWSGVPAGAVTALANTATYGTSSTSLTGPSVSPPAANYLVVTQTGINGAYSGVGGSWALLPQDSSAWIATSGSGAQSASFTDGSSVPAWCAATIAIGPAISSAVNSGALMVFP
jgi:hypothetical protein